MKPTTLFSLTTLLLTSLTTASIVDSAQEIIDSAKSHLNRFPLTVAIQIPCCTKPPCPGCPAARGNATLGLDSISFPQTGSRAMLNKIPGCGEGFDAQDCLRFFQVMLATWEKPVGISVEKIGKEEKGGVEGCGVESSPGECLRYLKGFLDEVRKPLERTLGDGSVSDAPGGGDGAEGGCAAGHGKSEL